MSQTISISIAAEIDNTDCDISPISEFDQAFAVILTPSVPDTSVGIQLQAVHGSWTNNPTTYSYQWQRSFSGTGNWTDISGGTYSDYVVQLADVGYYLRPLETASNLAGSATQAGQVVGPIGGDIGPPPLSAGSLVCRSFARL